jgi:hypothetical protein
MGSEDNAERREAESEETAEAVGGGGEDKFTGGCRDDEVHWRMSWRGRAKICWQHTGATSTEGVGPGMSSSLSRLHHFPEASETVRGFEPEK